MISGALIRRKISMYAFVFVVFLFVGLRLDTGFDWPAYKEIYTNFQQEFYVSDVPIYSLIYQQEVGSILLLGLSAQYFPNYEFFQAIVTFLFLWSMVSLSNSVGSRMVALAIALSFVYLLWSVGFSTIRQSIAISFFNFGLAQFIRGRRVYGMILYAAAPLFQLSAVAYIAAHFLSGYLLRKKGFPRFRSFMAATIVTAALMPLAIDGIIMASSLAAFKLEHYLARGETIYFGVSQISFVLFFSASALIASIDGDKESPGTAKLIAIRRLIIILSAFGISCTFFSVARDRLSYEVFILVSVLIAAPGVRYRLYFMAFFVFFGAFTTVISIFQYPHRTAFDPYQNVIISYIFDIPSTGLERSRSFIEDIAK